MAKDDEIKEAKRLTWTRLVVDTLKIMDDFLSGPQLCDLTGGSVSQISATLHHLQAKKVVDAVLVHDVPFWFLTGEDMRVRARDLRRDYDKRNRPGGYVSKRKQKIFPTGASRRTKENGS